MALFAIWQDRGAGQADRLHERLLAEAHIVPERITRLAIDTAHGRWQIAAFASASAFYSADAQLWTDAAGGACVIHGLIWRAEPGGGHLLDAAAVAALLDRPGAVLPSDLAGEYLVARLHPSGVLEAFGDPAGLHQMFTRDGQAAIASRAGFLAALADDWRPEPDAGLWLAAMGYRAGTRSAWRGVSQLPQGARFVAGGGSARVVPSRTALLPPVRGFAQGGEALIEEGLAQARSAILLAAGDGPLDLPITGGKDSRVVLAIALAAGLRDRLTLFTRGYPGHPDVLAGEAIARLVGVPHRREAPLGSDLGDDMTARAFVHLQAVIAAQADGAMGGWDNISGTATARDTIVSGHMGELLKAYAKRLPAGGRLDPIEMVRLQAPFDPMELLGDTARARLAEELAAQMDEARAAGAGEADLPDLFYWRNRIPNWLGGIRGIKSFERQPVLPLGVPALMRLAFLMTPDERRVELAHYRLIARAAPDLLPVPFAHQKWHASLGAPDVEPYVAAAGSNLFGTWQWAINRNPRLRASLCDLFAGADVPLWQDVDRARLIDRLHDRRFDYFDCISLLGILTSVMHQAGMVRPARLGGGEGASRPLRPLPPIASTPRLVGHLDSVEGDARVRDGVLTPGTGRIAFNGWVQAPDWPGASVGIEARVDGTVIGATSAGNLRHDLAAAGIGDGRHGFYLEVDAADLAGARQVTLSGIESGDSPAGGTLRIG